MRSGRARWMAAFAERRCPRASTKATTSRGYHPSMCHQRYGCTPHARPPSWRSVGADRSTGQQRACRRPTRRRETTEGTASQAKPVLRSSTHRRRTTPTPRLRFSPPKALPARPDSSPKYQPPRPTGSRLPPDRICATTYDVRPSRSCSCSCSCHPSCERIQYIHDDDDAVTKVYRCIDRIGSDRKRFMSATVRHTHTHKRSASSLGNQPYRISPTQPGLACAISPPAAEAGWVGLLESSRGTTPAHDRCVQPTTTTTFFRRKECRRNHCR
jgi:uncharacterized protein YjhX (UPF0386 family)